jgi:hypothetical protein
MRDASRLIAAAVGALGVLCAVAVSAQTPQGVTRLASLPLPSGTIQGLVQDEAGEPVAGAMVSALGSSTAFGVTDRFGHFALRSLSPGPYLVRAHMAGFIAPRGRIVQVLPSTRASSSIALRHVNSVSAVSPPILPASMGGVGTAPEPAATEPDPPPATAARPGDPSNDGNDSSQRDGEIEWRLRHARRSVLNDAVDQVLIADAAPPPGAGALGPRSWLDRGAGGSAARVASLFADKTFFGQVNLLTTSSFDTPQDLFTTRAFPARSVANMLVGAPVGDHADWTVRGAVTQGDIASWLLFGDYVTRGPARHRYDVGVSYSMQQYDGGNFALLRNVSDGSRNVGTLHGFDTFAVTSALSVTYGARYARYDYLDGKSLLSPRAAVTYSPVDHLRVNALVSSSALAPGAEEFMPPSDTGVWLPPQRTFSSLDSRPLVAERTTHVEAGLERDIAPGTAVSVRAFHQHVDNQLVTLFDVAEPGRPPATSGHYFVADGGRVDASGYSAGLKAVVAERVHGSIEYSFARASWNAADYPAYLVVLAPSALRPANDRIHDVSTSLETDIPETLTRVILLYRLSNGFVGRDLSARPALDARFDVQVRQGLPFMDFSSAKWEMLVAVRNFFRDSASDQSIYDELLVVRPPKRVVGGLTLRF